MKIRTTIFSALLLGALLIPGTSQAFELVDAKAYQVTDSTTLFTITLEFGYLNADAWLPVVPTWGNAGVANAPHLSYQFVDETGEVIRDGAQGALILSDVSIQDSYYTIATGDRAQLTLLAIHRADTGGVSASGLEVTSLGNMVNTGSETKYLEASTEQLAGYRTTVSGIAVE